MTDDAPEFPSGRIDMLHPDSNMFGVQPCPKCKSIYRIPMLDGVIECEGCGFIEPITGEKA